MALKKLYANGDSWTYGQELGEIPYRPDELDYKFYNTWPWWLAQRMKLPQVINDSKGGGSCDRIFRTTVNYIKNHEDLSDTLFVIGWTSAERWEFSLLNNYDFHNGTEIETHPYLHYVDLMYNNVLSVNGDPSWTDKMTRLQGLKNKWFRIREYEADLEKVRQYIYIITQLVESKGGTVHHMFALGDYKHLELVDNNLLPYTLLMLVQQKGWSVKQHSHPTEETQQKIADTIYDALQKKRK